MKTLIITFSIIFISTLNYAQENTIALSDFYFLNNTNWKGTLTYIDYQSEKPTDVDATLQITIEGDKIKSNMQYTYEPNKNNKSSVTIKMNGTYFGSEKVVSNTFKNNLRTIVTTYKGLDGGKKATIYMTRIFNSTIYTVSKRVVFKDTSESLIRNTYKFMRI